MQIWNKPSEISGEAKENFHLFLCLGSWEYLHCIYFAEFRFYCSTFHNMTKVDTLLHSELTLA